MISRYEFSNPPQQPACHCLGVTEGEIRSTIDAGELNTVRQVTHACGAGGGCTACHRHIRRFLQEAAQERARETVPVECPVAALGFT